MSLSCWLMPVGVENMSKKISCAIFCLIALFSTAVCAQESLAGAIMVFAKGKCTTLSVSGEKYTCKAVVYSHFKNGRTAWQVAIPDGAIMLAGGRDSQLDPTRYVPQIDTLRAGRGDGSSQPYKAQGTCTAKLSADGVYLHSLSCSATNGIEDVQIEFFGDGTPVDRKTL